MHQKNQLPQGQSSSHFSQIKSSSIMHPSHSQTKETFQRSRHILIDDARNSSNEKRKLNRNEYWSSFHSTNIKSTNNEEESKGFDGMNSQSSKFQAIQSKLLKEYTVEEGEKRRLLNENESLKSKITILESQIMILRNKLCDKDLQVARMKQRDSSIVVSEVQFSKLSHHNSVLQSEKNALTDKIAQLQRRISILESSNVNLQAQYMSKIERNQNLSSLENGKIKQEVRSLKNQLFQLKHSNSQMKDQSMRMGERLIQLENSHEQTIFSFQPAINKSQSTLKKEKHQTLQRKIKILQRQNAGMRSQLSMRRG